MGFRCSVSIRRRRDSQRNKEQPRATGSIQTPAVFLFFFFPYEYNEGSKMSAQDDQKRMLLEFWSKVGRMESQGLLQSISSRFKAGVADRNGFRKTRLEDSASTRKTERGIQSGEVKALPPETRRKSMLRVLWICNNKAPYYPTTTRRDKLAQKSRDPLRYLPRGDSPVA